jgi:hypothetical protein
LSISARLEQTNGRRSTFVQLIGELSCAAGCPWTLISLIEPAERVSNPPR